MKNAVFPEELVEGVVYGIDLFGLLVFVLEVAGVNHDGLDVLLHLKVIILHLLQPLIDLFLALLPLVVRGGGDDEFADLKGFDIREEVDG